MLISFRLIKKECIDTVDFVVRSINKITFLGRVNHQITIGPKDRLKTFLSEGYRKICDQDQTPNCLVMISQKMKECINLYLQRKSGDQQQLFQEVQLQIMKVPRVI